MLVIVVELDRLVGVWTVRARTLVSLSPAEEVSQRHPTLLPGKQSRLLSPDLPTKQCRHPDSLISCCLPSGTNYAKEDKLYPASQLSICFLEPTM